MLLLITVGGSTCPDTGAGTPARRRCICGMDATATFSLFVRELPTSRNFLLACGLDDLLSELETFRFSADDIAYLRSLDLLPESLFSSPPALPTRWA